MMGPDHISLTDVVEALERNGCRPKQRGAELYARCPVHGGDDFDSLSVREADDGRPLIHCHSKGCAFGDVIAALDLEYRNEPHTGGLGDPVAVYHYTDENGVELFQVRRFQPKTFRQYRPDGTPGVKGVRRVLYRLPVVRRAIKDGETIYVVEGERDVETLEGLGLVATCNPGGAGKWRDEYTDTLTFADVVILPDGDEPGREHAEMVSKALAAVATTVKVVNLPGLPPKGDVSDWTAAGGTAEELLRLVDAAEDGPRLFVTLSELMQNPELLKAPEALAVGFVYEGRLTVLAAREKLGKSTLMRWLAAALSHIYRVLWVGLEEYLGDAVRGFQTFGPNAENIAVIDQLPNGPGDLIAALDQFAPAVVFIDSFARYAEGRVTDFNAAAQVTPVMVEVADLCHARNIAALMSHHAKKSDGTFRDSTAIPANADIMIEMHEVRGDAFARRFEIRGRIPIEPFTLRFTGSGYEGTTGHGSVRDQVLDAVMANPGLSKRSIRGSIQGKASIIDGAIRLLESDELIINRGSETRSEYHPTAMALKNAGTRSGHGPGHGQVCPMKTQWDTAGTRSGHGPGHGLVTPTAQHPRGVQGDTAENSGLDQPSGTVWDGGTAKHG